MITYEIQHKIFTTKPFLITLLAVLFAALAASAWSDKFFTKKVLLKEKYFAGQKDIKIIKYTEKSTHIWKQRSKTIQGTIVIEKPQLLLQKEIKTGESAPNVYFFITQKGLLEIPFTVTKQYQGSTSVSLTPPPAKFTNEYAQILAQKNIVFLNSQMDKNSLDVLKNFEKEMKDFFKTQVIVANKQFLKNENFAKKILTFNKTKFYSLTPQKRQMLLNEADNELSAFLSRKKELEKMYGKAKVFSAFPWDLFNMRKPSLQIFDPLAQHLSKLNKVEIFSKTTIRKKTDATNFYSRGRIMYLHDDNTGGSDVSKQPVFRKRSYSLF